MPKEDDQLAIAYANEARTFGQYNGIPIVRRTIAIRNAGDGLSNAMKFNALGSETNLALGQHKVYVVLECDVIDHHHPLLKGEDDLCEEKVILRAGDATLIDGDVVQDQLEKQRLRIVEAQEAARKARGEGQLPGVTGNTAAEFDEDTEESVLRTHHSAGLHNDEPAAGCPACVEEG